MKHVLTVLPGVFLASALTFATPAIAADRDARGTAPSVQPVAMAVARAPHAGGDHDFDRGFRGGFGFRGFYGGFWPGYYAWAPFGYNWWPGYYGYGYGYYGYHNYDGGLKLKVTGPNPKRADVYADGAYVGTVDDFNGVFQKLTLAPGPYTIEIRANGYQPLTVKVRIEPDTTITYRGHMQKTD